MPDEEDDDSEYRRRIAQLLEKYGFGWVVEQAEAQVAEGKPTSKQVSEREIRPAALDPMFTIRKPQRRRASLITSEEYTEREKLEILLDGLSSAILERANLEQAILEKLPEFEI